MISDSTIASAVELLVKTAEPFKVILFGSYATGNADENSDLDFLVVERDVPKKHKEMVRLRKALRPLKVPADVLVIDEDTHRDMINIPGTVHYWAEKEGKVVYDSSRSGRGHAAKSKSG